MSTPTAAESAAQTRTPEREATPAAARGTDSPRRGQQSGTGQQPTPRAAQSTQQTGAQRRTGPQPDAVTGPAITIRMVGGDTLEVQLPPGPISRELSEQMAELARHLGIGFAPRKLSPSERPRPPEKRAQP